MGQRGSFCGFEGLFWPSWLLRAIVLFSKGKEKSEICPWSWPDPFWAPEQMRKCHINDCSPWDVLASLRRDLLHLGVRFLGCILPRGRTRPMPQQTMHGPGCRIRWFDVLPGDPEKCQEGGQEAQGELIRPGGCPPGHFKGPWTSWPSSWPFSGPPGSPSNHLILQPA